MEVHKITPTFAAEIRGVDISRPLDSATIEAILDASAENGVIVFRDQKLDNETQEVFARQFGELESSAFVYRKDNKHRIKSPTIADVSNIDENNKLRGRDDRRRLEMLQNLLWHSDASFRPVVGALSMLFAHLVPPSGGETEFADTRGGYDALSDEMKATIAPLMAEHVYGHSRTQLGFPSFSEEERQALPPVQHPLVRVHARSGRKALYLGAHASHIVGWPIPEGRMLLLDLLEHTTKPERVYSHKWRVGDMVIWDNRVTLHRGRRYDESYPRDLRRTTTRDVPEPLSKAS